MRALGVFGIAAGALAGGLVAGVGIGSALTKRDAVTTDLIALSFAGNRAVLAFEEMKPEGAWQALAEYRVLVATKGNALDDGLRHMELMLVDARLALLAKELKKDDRTWHAEAISECRRAEMKDCTQARLERLARRRSEAK